jgi:hypothetical protein
VSIRKEGYTMAKVREVVVLGLVEDEALADFAEADEAERLVVLNRLAEAEDYAWMKYCDRYDLPYTR